MHNLKFALLFILISIVAIASDAEILEYLDLLENYEIVESEDFDQMIAESESELDNE